MKNSEILNHLCQDAILKKVITESNKKITPSLELDIYHFLLESIVSQQLSVKVADVIFNRFLDLFVDRYPNPKELILLEDDLLRSVGLSYRKAAYLKNVAKFSLHHNLEFEHLQEKSDEEIIKLLTQIKGVGKWTVQMILMFPMDRLDVLPIDDLGIQNNMKTIYKLTSEKKELKQEITKIANNWKPYRSLACKYIWNFSG